MTEVNFHDVEAPVAHQLLDVVYSGDDPTDQNTFAVTLAAFLVAFTVLEPAFLAASPVTSAAFLVSCSAVLMSFFTVCALRSRPENIKIEASFVVMPPGRMRGVPGFSA